MSEFLYHYHPVEPATWFYLSSLLTIGLFFKFSRLWSVRNLDLLLLILLGPGLLFIHYGRRLDENPPRAANVDVTGLEHLDEGLVAGVRDPATEESGVGSSGSEIDRAATSDAGASLAEKTDVSSSSAAATSSQGEPQPTDLAADLADEGTSDVVEDGRTRGQRIQKYGYLWLFGMGGVLLVRLLADPTMVRRPLLEPNLSAGGLTFIGCSLFVFLMANVISRPAQSPQVETLGAQEDAAEEAISSQSADGPGHALLAGLPSVTRKTLAIVGQLTIAVGMVLIGYWHFENIVMGIGAAALYMMLPYTALMTNEIKHVLPAACLVWAVLGYRRPLASGICLGLAGGMTYYPLFLLPLWLSFYWARGLVRFVSGVLIALVALSFVLFSSDDVVGNMRLMFGLLPPAVNGLRGIWDEALGGWNTYYRIPVLAAFVALASSMALWPAQKNLGTLLSCSAAVMVATQFWHGYGGGTYMAWYLPLLLLTVFRPNLEDRVALTVLAEGWFPKRLASVPTGKAALVAAAVGLVTTGCLV